MIQVVFEDWSEQGGAPLAPPSEPPPPPPSDDGSSSESDKEETPSTTTPSSVGLTSSPLQFVDHRNNNVTSPTPSDCPSLSEVGVLSSN